MGGACSSQSADGNPYETAYKSELNNNRIIDERMEADREIEEHKIKLLLLGPGESGKSTVFKQMRILHGTPRDDDELRMYGVVIRANIIVAVRKLCLLLRTLGLEEALQLESEQSDNSIREAYDRLMTHVVSMTSSNNGPQDAKENGMNGEEVEKDWVGQSPRAGLAANSDAKLFLRHADAIRVLWRAKTMKEVWLKRATANVIDGHKEYLQDLDRISSPSFKPTDQDVLLARMRTTNVSRQSYKISGIEFEVYDVGGQRSERRKWLPCFDHVDAVMFVAALSEYDQTLAESKRTNRMVEALELFRSICNNRAFVKTSIMLFLNKKDIFREKLTYSDIASQKPFDDYIGPTKDMESGVLYFMERFKECMIDDELQDSYIYVTTATDTSNMEFVLDSTQMIIMTDNLRKSGILGND